MGSGSSSDEVEEPALDDGLDVDVDVDVVIGGTLSVEDGASVVLLASLVSSVLVAVGVFVREGDVVSASVAVAVRVAAVVVGLVASSVSVWVLP